MINKTISFIPEKTFGFPLDCLNKTIRLADAESIFTKKLNQAKKTELIISGGKPLFSSEFPLKAPGSKWGVAEMITASLIADRKVILHNVPPTLDTFSWVEILKDIGAKPEYSESSQVLTIDPSSINNLAPKNSLIQSIRASFHIIAPLLTKKGKVTIAYPGGDKIGDRPVSQHLQVLEKMGMNYTMLHDGVEAMLDEHFPKKIDINLEKPQISVTILAMIVASKLNQNLLLSNIPRETEILDAAKFLRTLGADIEVHFDSQNESGSYIRVNKGINKSTDPAVFEIPPDRTWALSFALLGPMTNGSVTVVDVRKEDFGNTIDHLSDLGIHVQFSHIEGKDCLTLSNDPDLKPYAPDKIEAGYLPRTNSDMLPFIALAATLKKDVCFRLGDTLLRDRDSYLLELKKMGAKIEILDGSHDFIVQGVQKLQGTVVEGKDLRATMVLIMAALSAQGTSVVKGMEHILRGYPNIIDYLKNYFNADIKEIRVFEDNGLTIKWDIQKNSVYDLNLSPGTYKNKDLFMKTLKELLLFSDNNLHIEKCMDLLNDPELKFELTDDEKLLFLDSILRDSPASPFFATDQHFLYPQYHHDFAKGLKEYNEELNLSRPLKVVIFGPGNGKKVYYNRMCAKALDLTIEYFAFDIDKEFLSKTHDLNPEAKLEVLDLRKEDILDYIYQKGLNDSFDYIDFTSVLHEVFSFPGIKFNEAKDDEEFAHYSHDRNIGIASVKKTLNMAHVLLKDQGILKILDGVRPDPSLMNSPVFIKYNQGRTDEFAKLLQLISTYPYSGDMMLGGGKIGGNSWFGISTGILNYYLEKIQFMAEDFRSGLTSMDKEIQELYHYFTAPEYSGYLQESGFSCVMCDVHQQITQLSMYNDYFKLRLSHPEDFLYRNSQEIPIESIPTIMDQRLEITARKNHSQETGIKTSLPKIPLSMKGHLPPFSEGNAIDSLISENERATWIEQVLSKPELFNEPSDFLMHRLIAYDRQVNQNNQYCPPSHPLFSEIAPQFMRLKMSLFFEICQSKIVFTQTKLTPLEIWNTFLPISINIITLREMKAKETGDQNYRLILGITGSIASGKTSFTKDLAFLINLIFDKLNNEQVDCKGSAATSHYETDNDFLPDWMLKLYGIQKTHPDSYDIKATIKRISNLKHGIKVIQKSYDHINSKSGGEKAIIESAPIILVEGLNVLHHKSGPYEYLHKLLDYSIFIDADETSLKSWALKREEEREVSRKKVLKNHTTRDFATIWDNKLFSIFKTNYEKDRLNSFLVINKDKRHERSIHSTAKLDLERRLEHTYKGLVMDIDHTITSVDGKFDLNILDFILDRLKEGIPIGIFTARNVHSLVLKETGFLKTFYNRLTEKGYSPDILKNLYISSSEGGTFINTGEYVTNGALDFETIIKNNPENTIDSLNADALKKIITLYLGLDESQMQFENYRVLLKQLNMNPLEAAFTLNSIFDLFDDLPYRASPSENSVLIVSEDQNKSMPLHQFSKITDIKPDDLISIGDQGQGSDLHLLKTGLSITVGNKHPKSEQISIPELFGLKHNQGTSFLLNQAKILQYG
ncbi:MAG: hypothetical protein A2X42_13175 [Candidatus Margulisbacteria bacterium GWF2_38_17]|nr:MAG: hypothetical protein A2X42_13175 [Candidatus Margulisbacteria bacterium GWF2_38_17]